MDSRKSLYRFIHKGIRRMMFDLVARASRTDFNNAEELSVLRAETEGCFQLLASHAAHETEQTTAAVLEHCPELADLVGPAHRDQDEEMDCLRSALAAIRSNSPDADANGHDFVIRLTRFFGDLLMHMADEELEIMPALQRALDDPELVAIEQRIVSSISPDKLARFLSWMIPALSHTERVRLLSGMKDGAPPHVYEFVLNLARGVLSDREFGHLSSQIEVAVA